MSSPTSTPIEHLLTHIPHTTLKNANYTKEHISTIEQLINNQSMTRAQWPLHDKDGKFIPMVHTSAEKEGKVMFRDWIIVRAASLQYGQVQGGRVQMGGEFVRQQEYGQPQMGGGEFLPQRQEQYAGYPVQYTEVAPARYQHGQVQMGGGEIFPPQQQHQQQFAGYPVQYALSQPEPQYGQAQVGCYHHENFAPTSANQWQAPHPPHPAVAPATYSYPRVAETVPVQFVAGPPAQVNTAAAPPQAAAATLPTPPPSITSAHSSSPEKEVASSPSPLPVTPRVVRLPQRKVKSSRSRLPYHREGRSVDAVSEGVEGGDEEGEVEEVKEEKEVEEEKAEEMEMEEEVAPPAIKQPEQEPPHDTDIDMNDIFNFSDFPELPMDQTFKPLDDDHSIEAVNEGSNEAAPPPPSQATGTQPLHTSFLHMYLLSNADNAPYVQAKPKKPVDEEKELRKWWFVPEEVEEKYVGVRWPDLYAILGVKHYYDDSEILPAFKKLIREHFPALGRAYKNPEGSKFVQFLRFLLGHLPEREVMGYTIPYRCFGDVLMAYREEWEDWEKRPRKWRSGPQRKFEEIFLAFIVLSNPHYRERYDHDRDTKDPGSDYNMFFRDPYLPTKPDYQIESIKEARGVKILNVMANVGIWISKDHKDRLDKTMNDLVNRLVREGYPFDELTEELEWKYEDGTDFRLMQKQKREWRTGWWGEIEKFADAALRCRGNVLHRF